MDPLSIAASVAGLVTLAGVIISKGFGISDRFKNTENDLKFLLNEVSSFSGLLVGVQSHIQRDEASRRVSSSHTTGRPGSHETTASDEHLRTALKDCKAILEDINKLVEKLSKTPSFQLALRRDMFLGQATKLTTKLERYKSFFILAMQVNSRAHGKESRLISSQMKDRLKAIESAQRRLEDKYEAEIQSKGKDEILEWLGNATKSAHSDALESRHPQSGAWFLSSPEFTSWISEDSSSYLWLDGIAGSGKTVLMSMAIDYIQELPRGESGFSLAYHFCGAPNTCQDSLEKMLGRLLSQILRQTKSPDSPEVNGVFEELDRLKAKPRYPSVQQIKDILTTVANCFSTVFLVIDGIDELPHCDDLVDFIDDIVSLGGNFKFLISSRRQDDLTDRLLSFCRLSLSCDRIHDDIERYVRSRVSKLRWQDVPDIEEIIQGLVKGADGMFLWVVCQLNSLSRIRTAITKSALKSLPRGLGCTYETILSRLSEEDKRLAIKILQFIIFSERGLHLPELADAIAIEPSHINLQQLKGNKLRNEDDIFEICGSLIRCSKATGHLMLAHHSVREFLTSPYLDTGKHNPFYICSIDSTITLAVSCLRYLNFGDFDALVSAGNATEIVLDGLVAENPFLSYAACNWSYHVSAVRSESLYQLVPLLEMFFDPNHGNLRFWSAFAQYTHGSFWIPSSLTPLHVCSIVGACGEVIRLASSKASPRLQTDRGETALHLALDNGHPEIIKALIRVGVPINTRDQLGRSVLHRAIEGGEMDAVRLLLKAGADANAISHDGATAFSIAADNNWTPIMLEIAKKTDASLVLPDGRTTLHLAAQSGDIASAECLLLKSSSLLYWEDQSGWTALHFAAHHGHSSMISFLLDRGLRPSLDISKWSPAHSAIQKRDSISLKRLLESVWWVGERPLTDQAAVGPSPIPGWRARPRNRKYGYTGRFTEQEPSTQAESTSSGLAYRYQRQARTRNDNSTSRALVGEESSGIYSYTGSLTEGESIPSGPLLLDTPPYLYPRPIPSRFEAGTSSLLRSGGEILDLYESPTPRLFTGEESSRIDGIGPLKQFPLIVRSLLDLTVSLNYPDGVRCLLEDYLNDKVVELSHLKHSINDIQGSEMFRVLFLNSMPSIYYSILPVVVAKKGRDDIRSEVRKIINTQLNANLCGRLLKDSFHQWQREVANFLLEIWNPEMRADALHWISIRDWKGGPVNLMDLFCLLAGDGKPSLCPQSGSPISRGLRLKSDYFHDFIRDELIHHGPKNIRDIFSSILTFPSTASDLDLVKALTNYASQRGLSDENDRLINKLLSFTLLLVAQEGDEQLSLVLINAGADVNFRNKEGETALHLTARRADSNLANLLLSHGADIHVKDKIGMSPLCFAIQAGSSACVEFLVAQGAEADDQAIAANRAHNL